MSEKVSTTIRIEEEKYKNLKRAMLDCGDKGLQALVNKWIDDYIERWQASQSRL